MVRAVFAIALFVFAGAPAFAQTSTLSGVVIDSAGGVIPGADVVIKHNATGVTTAAVSNTEGVFTFPSVQTGTYTVTVTLQGFKTFVANDVVLATGTPASVKAVLEVGGVTETVTVTSSSEIIQTQSSTVSSRVSMNEITKLPMTSRSAMDFVNFLPGVSTPGGNRDATVNGLPRGMINITLDGVNIQDNTLRSRDGFFAIVSPRLDAIEEVTVSTAAQGSSDSGQGAVQVRFVTRSGSNDFTGSLYNTTRSDKWNANTWFNNRDAVAKAKLKQNQPGGRVGGPITIPGLFDGRNKAFFFVNYEEFIQPGELTRNRTLFHPRAEQGIFRYTTAAGATQEVNLLTLAAANGQTSIMDPVVAAMIGKIRSAASSSGSIKNNAGNPLLEDYSFNVEFEAHNYFPTFRVDYNITDAHRISTSTNYQKFTTFPDTLNGFDQRFPGFPVAGGQASIRKSIANSLRSTFGNLVNELRVSYAGAPVDFFPELTSSMWSEQGNFQLNFPLVTGPSPAPNQQGRNAYNWHFEDSVNYLRGSHSLTAGGSFTHMRLWSYNTNMLPRINFVTGAGTLVNGDPAQAMFTTANFPGASTTQLNNAQAMYALLTGRVASIDGDAALVDGNYVYMGRWLQEAKMQQAGFYLQDSWRWRPNFTINLGLRYELQYPFTPLNNSFATVTMESLCGRSGVNPNGSGLTACNLFQPGNMPGSIPEYINFTANEPAFETDYNNFAPSVGFAWQLGEKNGLLGGVLGDEAVVRGGWTRSYSREGFELFTARFGSNPGIQLLQEPDRSEGNANLGALPLLFRDTARLGPGTFPAAPVYPFRGIDTNSVNRIQPDIQVPWADSWTIGLQRGLGRNHAIEVRYVGTRSGDAWIPLNFNEVNIADNGFLAEFRAAQANLQANIAAGRGATFAFTGIPGTSPLPIYLAHFSGIGGAAANSPASYTSTLFANASFVNPLARFNPNIFAPASTNSTTGLFGTPQRRALAAQAGFPANFWVINPDKLGGANMTVNLGETRYDSLQLELRRRLHQGLQFQTSYVYGNGRETNFFSFRLPTQTRRDAGGTIGDLTHTFKSNVVWDLPFGRGRRFASNANAVVERLIGGWSLSLTSRIQSGRLVNLGNVRLVGMTLDEVQDLFKLRIDATGRAYMLPAEIINESVKAFNVSATSATGYGAQGAPTGRYFAPANGPDCLEEAGNGAIAPNQTGSGPGMCGTGDLVVTGPLFNQHDLGISKRISLFGRTNLELRLEALNVFNNVNFAPVGGVGSTTVSGYEVTGLTGTNLARVVQLIGRFNF